MVSIQFNSMLDARRTMLSAQCSISARQRSWTGGIPYRCQCLVNVDARCAMSVRRCSSTFNTHYSMFDVHHQFISMLDVGYTMHDAQYSILDVPCPDPRYLNDTYLYWYMIPLTRHPAPAIIECQWCPHRADITVTQAARLRASFIESLAWGRFIRLEPSVSHTRLITIVISTSQCSTPNLDPALPIQIPHGPRPTTTVIIYHWPRRLSLCHASCSMFITLMLMIPFIHHNLPST